MKLSDKAKDYASKLHEKHILDCFIKFSARDFEKGYMTALQDFREAIKANPKLIPKQILEHLEKEI